MKTSFDHLPERKQHELALISTILRDTLEEYLVGKQGSKAEFRILKIILFGSHAKGGWVSDIPNGYVSDYDILVIVNKPSLVEEDLVWRRAEEQIDRKVKSAPLGLIVHTLEEVNEQLRQGHYFFKDIREEGIEIFAATPKELAEPGDLSDEERRQIAQQHFEQWFQSAGEFLEFSQIAIDKGYVNKAAFELHQAAERFFACTLLVLTNYLPKTHNIEKLKKYCAEQDLAFADIFPMDDKFHRRSFRRLQRAYIDARYSMHYEITEEELVYLQGEVEKLKGLVEQVCLGRLEG
ncbi:HEPN domain-containing protein [Vibrio gazogenes]|uniref:HEPN domain-containing protein n=1 Tax=Vibrio gazogenes DSM 21264 = NBRC 103151 TaxID=1123492 RepID=A0A1M5DZ09_VIBGA|nr:HEPN domain-containing protein [Vibrio gazogenes]USP14923.1 HEPN domain-containing protein [Vibrio gazogenes]SHF72213.1 HEPN domain-containing protein [Vibrio gazogenes DSM 21264] [Vibrio gazogenes DSM 21264 = NBRC 103151]SJN54333.1 HEPN domain protein [Vibrio gazogenes]